MRNFIEKWRFAAQRRWFTYLGMAVVFAIACVLLSRWQFGRNEQTIAANKLVTGNYAASAVAPSTLLPALSSYSPHNAWRKVELSGEYLPAKQLLVRDRSLGSDPGFEVLTPFRESNGDIFIVDRGWVSIGQKHSYPDYIPPVPKGHEVVTARLQGSETVLPGRVSPRGQISEINLPTVRDLTRLPRMYTGAYGLLSSESPAPAVRPIAAAKPVLDPGPFLSYAFQWILFAIMGFAGLAWALRQEYRIRNAADPVERERAAERDRKARVRPLTDAQIEDAQIEAAQIAATQIEVTQRAADQASAIRSA
ncbi:MAG TPA: SURF1 family protein [Galbitalea sp.]|jgi:cytochrome oxidase assembly protein ShyY1|nr:SURF1 family protein [Galbitalea sp.]